MPAPKDESWNESNSFLLFIFEKRKKEDVKEQSEEKNENCFGARPRLKFVLKCSRGKVCTIYIYIVMEVYLKSFVKLIKCISSILSLVCSLTASPFSLKSINPCITRVWLLLLCGVAMAIKNCGMT